MLIIALALYYSITMVYLDNSCASVTVEAARDCRVGAIEVWCPNPEGSCVARDLAPAVAAIYPTCEQIDRAMAREDRGGDLIARHSLNQ